MSPTNYFEGQHNTDITNALNQVLADMLVLHMKLNAFHWNVEGPHFKPLHELFEEQYTEIRPAMDNIAERARALRVYAITDMASALKTSKISETTQVPSAEDMVQILHDDHLTLVDSLRKGVAVAEKAEDVSTADMCTALVTVHEKAAWLLKSHLVGAA